MNMGYKIFVIIGLFSFIVFSCQSILYEDEIYNDNVYKFNIPEEPQMLEWYSEDYNIWNNEEMTVNTYDTDFVYNYSSNLTIKLYDSDTVIKEVRHYVLFEGGTSEWSIFVVVDSNNWSSYLKDGNKYVDIDVDYINERKPNNGSEWYQVRGYSQDKVNREIDSTYLTGGRYSLDEYWRLDRLFETGLRETYNAFNFLGGHVAEGTHDLFGWLGVQGINFLTQAKYYLGFVWQGFTIITNILTNALLMPTANMPTPIKVIIVTPIWIAIGFLMFVIMINVITVVARLIRG